MFFKELPNAIEVVEHSGNDATSTSRRHCLRVRRIGFGTVTMRADTEGTSHLKTTTLRSCASQLILTAIMINRPP